MNATFTVTFKGFSHHAVLVLERMLRDDIAGYPARVSMESASVALAKPQPKPQPKPKRDVPLPVVKAAVKKVKADA